jgi:hypothetical protein
MNKSIVTFMICGAVFNAVIAILNFTQGNFDLMAVNIVCAVIGAWAALTYPWS